MHISYHTLICIQHKYICRFDFKKASVAARLTTLLYSIFLSFAFGQFLGVFSGQQTPQKGGCGLHLRA